MLGVPSMTPEVAAVYREKASNRTMLLESIKFLYESRLAKCRVQARILIRMAFNFGTITKSEFISLIKLTYQRPL